MEFYEVLKNRRSIRGYRPDPIPEASLQKIGEAVNAAPSACNRQPWRFEVVLNPARRAAIVQAAPFFAEWLATAPAIAVVYGDRSACWVRPEGTPSVEIDVGIAMEHLVLAATAEGLGTCWVCAFEKAAMNAALQVEAPWSVEAITPLGYAAVPPRNGVARKPLASVFQVSR